jgi:hypothetical protein
MPRREGKTHGVRTLTFPQFVACEAAEAVVSRVLVGFAGCWIVEDLLDKFVDAQAVVENQYADVGTSSPLPLFFVSADSKEFTGDFCLFNGNHLRSAIPKALEGRRGEGAWFVGHGRIVLTQ